MEQEVDRDTLLLWNFIFMMTCVALIGVLKANARITRWHQQRRYQRVQWYFTPLDHPVVPVHTELRSQRHTCRDMIVRSAIHAPWLRRRARERTMVFWRTMDVTLQYWLRRGRFPSLDRLVMVQDALPYGWSRSDPLLSVIQHVAYTLCYRIVATSDPRDQHALMRSVMTLRSSWIGWAGPWSPASPRSLQARPAAHRRRSLSLHSVRFDTSILMLVRTPTGWQGWLWKADSAAPAVMVPLAAPQLRRRRIASFRATPRSARSARSTEIMLRRVVSTPARSADELLRCLLSQPVA